jgi:hypothetical protein
VKDYGTSDYAFGRLARDLLADLFARAKGEDAFAPKGFMN